MKIKLTEKKRFAIVATAGLAAGAFLTHLVERLAYQQDLEFLGMTHDMVQEELKRVRRDDDQE